MLRVGRAPNAPKENGVPYVCSSIYLLIYLSNVLAAYKMYQLNIIQMYEQHTKRINQIFIECTSSVQNVFNFEQFYNWTRMVLLRVKKVRREKQALSIEAYRTAFPILLSTARSNCLRKPFNLRSVIFHNRR